MSELDQKQLFIDGEHVDADSGETFTVDSPSTGSAIALCAKAGPKDVDRAVEAAHRAFEQGPWPRMQASERARKVFELARLIRDHAEEMARIEVAHAGKIIDDARGEVQSAANVFEYYAGAATKYCGQTIPVSGNGIDLTLRQPLGVAGLIVPWNFPIAIASWKLAPALAVGCTAVLKPASATPLTALFLGELCQEAGFPPGVVNIITGPGSSAGGALVNHPKVAKIAFTGETSTGQDIWRSAASTLKRVSLELGGKSPLIVCHDADIATAASKAPFSVFGHAGQDCCSRSRGFVHESVYEQFVELFAKRTEAITVGDPMDPKNEMGPLISRAQVERVESYIAIGKEEGCGVVCGGGRVGVAGLENGHFIRPAVLEGARNDMRVAREEIFGPVAVMIPWRDEDELLEMVNDTPFGLSGAVWSRDSGRALRIAKSIRSGNISINTNSSVFVEAPFGGFKMSGVGRDLGMAALDNYTEIQNIFISLD